LKNARRIWQVDLGVSSADLRIAPKHSMAAVQEGRSAPAEVQQGERQVRATVGISHACRRKKSPFGRQQSTSAF